MPVSSIPRILLSYTRRMLFQTLSFERETHRICNFRAGTPQFYQAVSFINSCVFLFVLHVRCFFLFRSSLFLTSRRSGRSYVRKTRLRVYALLFHLSQKRIVHGKRK